MFLIRKGRYWSDEMLRRSIAKLLCVVQRQLECVAFVEVVQKYCVIAWWRPGLVSIFLHLLGSVRSVILKSDLKCILWGLSGHVCADTVVALITKLSLTVFHSRQQWRLNRSQIRLFNKIHVVGYGWRLLPELECVAQRLLGREACADGKPELVRKILVTCWSWRVIWEKSGVGALTLKCFRT